MNTRRTTDQNESFGMERDTQVIAERQVADAWQRIETWLNQNAPATMDTLRPGASEDGLAEIQRAIGVRIPAELKALWRHSAGVSAEPGRDVAYLLGEWAPMHFDGIIQIYERFMSSQQQPGSEDFLIWRPAWIPFAAIDASDCAAGLLLDAETGEIWHWDRYGDRSPKFESLTVYLEEMADILEAPGLSNGAKPGLLNGALVWGPPVDVNQAAHWIEFTG
ncbi:SMI1/KNR4 family protein [Streptomyces sp. 8L]|uniref:SMI1/KNR4 family protein n=1 Tax=Streptomyces sp. 8L TaxID=2877242 RepID=UPI001CD3277E|nr:SMI1/KNR4 family protein [Streptomyces sp. 8L]MCA1218138.1 SMI1/KNR4 family protein [Streptomyces sp. 8L]